MTQSIYHTQFGIEVNLSEPDLGHPELPDLWDLMRSDRRPVPERGLQCMECRAARPHCPEWMYLVERDGTRFASHFNPEIADHPTSNESDEHKAYKERVATTAERAGFNAELEDRAADGKRRTDVLVRGADGRSIGWEIQLSYATLASVRKRSRIARQDGITPLWASPDDTREFINRVPWALLPDATFREIKNGKGLLIRGGIRALEFYRCSFQDPIGAQYDCPVKGHSRCGQLHGMWKPAQRMELDDLVRATGAGEYVPIIVPGRRITNRWWVPAEDYRRYADSVGGVPTEDDVARAKPQAVEQRPRPFDPTCHYGEDSGIRSPRAVGQDSPDAVITSATIRPKVPTAPAISRPTPGSCGALANRGDPTVLCGEPAHLYPGGWRCDRHRPRRVP